jgi:hypothetical protein
MNRETAVPGAVQAGNKQRLVLQFHGWQELRPTDESEIVALFLFSLMPAADRERGLKPTRLQTFWTEASLSRDLAARGRWPSLSKADKLKAMFRFAQERIQEAGRKLRQAPMYWTPRSPLEAGPPWDLARVPFPRPSAMVFEIEPAALAPRLESRKAAGLKSLGEA